MKLVSADLMRGYLERSGFTQARLARYCGCSRQFIWALLNGSKTTCSERVGRRVEEAFSLLPGTLFLTRESSQTLQKTKGEAA